MAMTAMDKCPFCGSSKLVPGRVGDNSGPYGFTPNEASRWAFTLRPTFAFNIGPAATFCGECCMVWCKADRKDAYQFIHDFGTETLNARVFGPGGNPSVDERAPQG